MLLQRDIDLWMVATNGLWILGVAIVLAAFSYHEWLARVTGQRFRQIIGCPSWRRSFSSGMFLTCLGWGVAQADSWERLIWIIVAIWFASELIGFGGDVPRRRG